MTKIELAVKLEIIAARSTHGEWIGYSEPDVNLPYSLFVRYAPLQIEPLEPLNGNDIDQNNLPAIVSALKETP